MKVTATVDSDHEARYVVEEVKRLVENGTVRHVNVCELLWSRRMPLSVFVMSSCVSCCGADACLCLTYISSLRYSDVHTHRCAAGYKDAQFCTEQTGSRVLWRRVLCAVTCPTWSREPRGFITDRRSKMLWRTCAWSLIRRTLTRC